MSDNQIASATFPVVAHVFESGLANPKVEYCKIQALIILSPNFSFKISGMFQAKGKIMKTNMLPLSLMIVSLLLVTDASGQTLKPGGPSIAPAPPMQPAPPIIPAPPVQPAPPIKPAPPVPTPPIIPAPPLQPPIVPLQPVQPPIIPVQPPIRPVQPAPPPMQPNQPGPIVPNSPPAFTNQIPPLEN